MTTVESILERLTIEVGCSDRELYSEQELRAFAESMVQNWDENTSGFVIAESLVDYFWDKQNTCRRCSECGRLFRSGYCVDAGAAYYCSDECLHTAFTPEEWEHEFNENEQSYWTEW